jgi:hypothetical protein
MKSAKILFAIFILLIFSQEGFDAYKQTGDKWFFIIVVIVSLILSGFLVRSAFKPKESILQEKKYKTYLWNFLKIVSIIGILGVIINIVRPQPDKHVIEINGLRISLDNCITGNVRMIKDIEDRKDYCECIAQKLADNETVITKYKGLLRNGQFNVIIKDLKNEDQIGLGIVNCFALTNYLKWTQSMKDSIKTEFLNQLKETGFEMTNDIEKYCDCLIKKLEEFPANEVITGELFESIDWIEIKSICTEASKY